MWGRIKCLLRRLMSWEKYLAAALSARGLIITALNQVVQVFNCSGLSASGFTATYSKKEGRAAALYFEERGWIYFFSCAASVNFILGNSTPNDALGICGARCFDLQCITQTSRQNLWTPGALCVKMNTGGSNSSVCCAHQSFYRSLLQHWNKIQSKVRFKINSDGHRQKFTLYYIFF